VDKEIEDKQFNVHNVYPKELSNWLVLVRTGKVQREMEGRFFHLLRRSQALAGPLRNHINS